MSQFQDLLQHINWVAVTPTVRQAATTAEAKSGHLLANEGHLVQIRNTIEIGNRNNKNSTDGNCIRTDTIKSLQHKAVLSFLCDRHFKLHLIPMQASGDISLSIFLTPIPLAYLQTMPADGRGRGRGLFHPSSDLYMPNSEIFCQLSGGWKNSSYQKKEVLKNQ